MLNPEVDFQRILLHVACGADVAVELRGATALVLLVPPERIVVDVCLAAGTSEGGVVRVRLRDGSVHLGVGSILFRDSSAHTSDVRGIVRVCLGDSSAHTGSVQRVQQLVQVEGAICKERHS